MKDSSPPPPQVEHSQGALTAAHGFSVPLTPGLTQERGVS